MQVNRPVVGWSLFAFVLVILAVALVIPAFLAKPLEKPGSASSPAAVTQGSPSSFLSPAFFSSSFFPSPTTLANSLSFSQSPL